jgi:intracellular septation protein A
VSAAAPTPLAARELGATDTSFRSVFLAGAPRFAREAFGPVAAFYVGWKVGNLAVGIALASAVGIALEVYERRNGRSGALALISVAFVLVQAGVGLIADSATVYLAQPVIVGAIWGVANVVSALIGRPLAGVFADSWYAFPPAIKTSQTYRRVFGIESMVWGVYLLARSGVRLLVLATESIGAFVFVQLATGFTLTIALVVWSVWFAVDRFERSIEWNEPQT